ncbi:hypothetical protein DSM112329_00029 [Paraconexibacter sp. AEG42_29]|uniref:Abnormal spindle-like microcephaly-associated protein ASH domain-containing protein n=1 Tax=Paraconexibacter sp. AEG42_29 TaxID=2997339 RepID=A0AAU7ANZ6_9ACTN
MRVVLTEGRALRTAGAAFALVLAFAGLGAQTAGAYSPVFSSSVPPATGVNPFSVAVGDLNGDGIPDLVTANLSSNNVSVLLGDEAGSTGKGDGTFTASPESPQTGSNPYSVAVGDLNGDTIPDLVTANLSSSNVSVLLGDEAGSTGRGDGTFTASLESPSTGTSPFSVAVGDLNGDTIPDLVTANAGSSNVSVLLGDEAGSTGKGDGTFTASLESPSTGTGPFSVAVGDLNGDTIPDLVTANVNSNDVSVLLGDEAGSTGKGDGTFTASPESPSTGSNPYSVAVGDLNGDTIPDLVTANPGSDSVSVLLGDEAGGTGRGDGTFTASPESPATGTDPYSVAVGDLNGDTIPDLVTANLNSNNVSVLLGDEAGSTGKGDGTFTASPESPRTGPSPRSVAVGDLNGDTIPDLVTANQNSNNVSVLLGDEAGSTGNGDGTFTASPESPQTGSNPYSVAVGDLNGDTIPDLVTANADSNDVSVLLGDEAGSTGKGDGTFTASPESPATGASPFSVAVGDLDGDGIPDLVTANANSNDVSVLLGDEAGSTGKGDGTFTASPESPATGSLPYSVAVGDLNGDTIPDLVTANLSSNDVSVLLGDEAGSTGRGDGTFTASLESPATGSLPYSVAVGDLNGDTIPDLVTANLSSNDVSVLLGNEAGSTGRGDGTFTASLESPATGTDPFSVAVGDLNGDTIPDLVTANLGSSSVSVLLGDEAGSTGKGDGTFTASPESPATGANPYSVAVGDLNGDTIPDLVTANGGSNSVSVLLGDEAGSTGKGDGTFTASPQSPATGNSPRSVAVGDLNGDGFRDLVTANAGANTATVMLQLPPAPPGVVSVAPGSVAFAATRAGASSVAGAVTFSNMTGAAVSVTGVTISGADAGQFAVDADGCSGTSVADGGSCVVQVVFAPGAAGSFSASLDVASSDPVSPTVSVALSGTGTRAGGGGGGSTPTTPPTPVTPTTPDAPTTPTPPGVPTTPAGPGGSGGTGGGASGGGGGGQPAGGTPSTGTGGPTGIGIGAGGAIGGGDGPVGLPGQLPSQLQVLRARVLSAGGLLRAVGLGRSLDVLAVIGPRASGVLSGSFLSGGRTTRFTVPVPKSGGPVKIRVRLPAGRAKSGIVTLSYAGDADTAAEIVRLRAASGRALLAVTQASVSGGVLKVSGTVDRRAKGVVRVAFLAEKAGRLYAVTARGLIKGGRWSVSRTLPAGVAAVGTLSVQYTGNQLRGIRGEQRVKPLAGARRRR